MLQTLVFLFLGLISLATYAQGGGFACNNYPTNTACDTSCNGYCRTTSCSARSVIAEQVSNTPWWMNDRPLLPIRFFIPADSCYNPNGSTGDIRTLPVAYAQNGITISSETIPHSFFIMTYPRCQTSPPTPNGIPCVTTPPTCAKGEEIPSGLHAGKCGLCTGGPHMLVFNLDGTPFMAGASQATLTNECNSCTAGCANFVNCYARNCSSGVVSPISCGISGGGTLPCGMSVSYASCPTAPGVSDCTFVSVEDPDPMATATAILGDPARYVPFCAAPTTSSTTSTTSSTTTSTVPPICTAMTGTCDANCSSLTVTMTDGQYFTTSAASALDNTWWCMSPVNATGQYSGGACTTGGSCSQNCRQCSQTNPNPGGGPGGPGDTCFAVGTKILMADQTQKNIEEIQVGEVVQIYDEESGRHLSSRVTETLHHEARQQRLFLMTFENGKSFTVNDAHPIYIFGSGKYISSLDVFTRWMSGLNPALQDADGNPLLIVDIQTWESFEPVYNLHVEGLSDDRKQYGIRGRGHNYFAEGVLVHNVKDASGASN